MSVKIIKTIMKRDLGSPLAPTFGGGDLKKRLAKRKMRTEAKVERKNIKSAGRNARKNGTVKTPAQKAAAAKRLAQDKKTAARIKDLEFKNVGLKRDKETYKKIVTNNRMKNNPERYKQLPDGSFTLTKKAKAENLARKNKVKAENLARKKKKK